MTMKSLEEEMADFARNVRVMGQIEFPVEVSNIESEIAASTYRTKDIGKWVSVRPVKVNKTYLGVFLGELPLDIIHHYHIETKVLTVYPQRNPAIYVPDLKRIVWGIESWWGIIKSPDELRQITDADIQNVWYVKALKELTENPPAES
jgi:hypothetical protein